MNDPAKEFIRIKLREILERCTKIDFSAVLREEIQPPFEGIELYLMDDQARDEVLRLQEQAKALIDGGSDEGSTGKAFYEYAKIINPDYPAFKYSFFVKRTPVEIFDRDKVKATIPGEMERWKNKERLKLKKVIERHDPPLSSQKIKKLEEDLEKDLAAEFEKLHEVLENWDHYDAVITTHAHCKSYPSLYYTMDTSSDYRGSDLSEKQKYYKKKDTLLRSSAPNLLWFKDDRPFSELRANDKISRIVRTYTPYCGTIYIKERK